MLFSETSDQTDYGYQYWSTENVADFTFQSGQDLVVREQFESCGFLANTNDTDYRAISDDCPAFGLAIDLGSISTTTISTIFSIGLAQEEAIQFGGETSVIPVTSL